MAVTRWPDGVAYQVTSRRDGQQKPTVEGQFVVDRENVLGNGPYEDGQARQDAEALFAQVYGAHTGGLTEYVFLRCELYGHEIRPV